MPSGKLRGEQIYRVRNYDGLVIEGFAPKQWVVPNWHVVLEDKSAIVWGSIAALLVSETTDSVTATLPDNTVVTVRSSSVTRRDTVESG